MLQALRLIDNGEIYNTICFEKEFLKDINNIIANFDIISDKNLF